MSLHCSLRLAGMMYQSHLRFSIFPLVQLRGWRRKEKKSVTNHDKYPGKKGRTKRIRELGNGNQLKCNQGGKKKDWIRERCLS